MDDLINRQAATEYFQRIIDATNTDGRYNLGFIDGLEFCINHLSTMSSTQPERKKGEWIIEEINKYELSYGTTAYEPVYRCSVCGRLTESYLRLDEPIMPEDADFPKFCPQCGTEMEVGEQWTY